MIYLDFSEAFGTISHDTLMDKLMKYRLAKLTLMWVENWLTGRAQSPGFTGTKSAWRLVTNGVPRGQKGGQPLFNLIINDLDAGSTSAADTGPGRVAEAPAGRAAVWKGPGQAGEMG